MSLTKYGTDTAIPIIIISVLLIAGGFFISNLPLKIGFILLGVLVLAFTLNFFRDPERTVPDVADGVLSPADGKVISITEVDEPEFLKGKAKQVCIFMSPLNVHVNRYPISGRVGYFRHVEGKYLVAFADKASDINERTLIGIEGASSRVLFKQIAGAVARRIVCPIAVGDRAVAGQRFGMIKFGSRVDVLMPPDAEVLVTMDQLVVAGETVLARLRPPTAPLAP
jgi:phosphatidylserine decarboxylase